MAGNWDAKTQAAYQAWRKAADKGYGDSPYDTPERMERIDANIRRLKANYDRLLTRGPTDS